MVVVGDGLSDLFWFLCDAQIPGDALSDPEYGVLIPYMRWKSVIELDKIKTTDFLFKNQLIMSVLKLIISYHLYPWVNQNL